jgi:arsenical pump membrane protein
MAVTRVALLLIGVAGAVLRPFRLPSWVLPLVCAVVVVAIGGISVSATRHALDPLASPVGFLLAAVPLAVLLDELGFFASLAEILGGSGRSSGGLWVLAALVTTVLNLDAAVVLLTPLYVRIGRRTGRDPLTLAFQPVLLACLASSALPVSNLTNLIAASWTSASTVSFITHLGLPSLVASAVGWWLYRWYLHPDRRSAESFGPATVYPATGSPAPVGDRRALTVGGVVVGLVLVGFVGGRSFGIQPWVVALGADLVLLGIVRRVPWRHVPWGTALVAGSLGVLAAAAVAHLHVASVVRGGGTLALARTVGVTALAANVINNLPALLVALPAVGHHATPAVWAVMMGVNMGPVLLVTGTLASLLWLDALGRLGVEVHARDFTRVGLRVGLPAAGAGTAVFLALTAAIH